MMMINALNIIMLEIFFAKILYDKLDENITSPRILKLGL